MLVDGEQRGLVREGGGGQAEEGADESGDLAERRHVARVRQAVQSDKGATGAGARRGVQEIRPGQNVVVGRGEDLAAQEAEGRGDGARGDDSGSVRVLRRDSTVGLRRGRGFLDRGDRSRLPQVQAHHVPAHRFEQLLQDGLQGAEAAEELAAAGCVGEGFRGSHRSLLGDAARPRENTLRGRPLSLRLSTVRGLSSRAAALPLHLLLQRPAESQSLRGRKGVRKPVGYLVRPRNGSVDELVDSAASDRLDTGSDPRERAVLQRGRLREAEGFAAGPRKLADVQRDGGTEAGAGADETAAESASRVQGHYYRAF